MPTAVTDRFATLDYIDYANNHVFMKSSNSNGFYEHHHKEHYRHDDGYHVEPVLPAGISQSVPPAAKELIGDALRRRVESIDHEFCEPGDEDTFFVADLGEVYRQHLRWKLNLPRVKPFYGMSY